MVFPKLSEHISLAKMNLFIVVKEVGILVATAVIAALFVNYFSPVGISVVGQWDSSKGTISARAKNDNVIVDEFVIDDVNVAREIYESGTAVFVDARTAEDYMDGHIKAAESIPVNNFDEAIRPFVERYALDTIIVTYCSGRTCEDSHRLSQLLVDYGYPNVSVFIDGFPAWQAEGLPIE